MLEIEIEIGAMKNTINCDALNKNINTLFYNLIYIICKENILPLQRAQV